MSGLETVEILFSDLEEVRQVLAACAGYFYAEDLQRAQINFAAVVKSPLTKEVELVQERFDGYLGDFLRERYEAEQLEDEEVLEDDDLPETILGVEVDQEIVELEPQEELSDLPLGAPKIVKRRGRRITKEELQERAEAEDAI